MENSIYLGLSRQMTLRTNMDIIANNVANMSTNGYRGQNTLFEEHIFNPRDKETDPLSFVYDRGQYQATEPGPLSTTGNQLDIALVGPGFLGVQAPGGDIQFTRDGSFQIEADGTLVTQAGFPVASFGGGNIVIPPDSTEIKIDETGMISNQNGELGQIMVTEFDNIQGLEQRGNNLYAVTGTNEQPAANTRVKQGMLEGSNVKPVIEMTNMIETLRDYQSMQNAMEKENERLRSAIQKLTRVN